MAGDFRDFLTRMVTGRTQQELEDDVSLGKADAFYSPKAALDKRKHAYASALATERLGPVLSGAAGFGKELLDIPTTGFDWNDIFANISGIQSALNRRGGL